MAAKEAARSNVATVNTVFRRLFMVLKPNFLVEIIRADDYGDASIAPLRGIVQDGSTPRAFSGRASLAEESIHAFDA